MHPLRALIVDRDEDFADRVQRCLREAGLEPETADGRRATLEIVAEKRPAILFIAVEQPRRSGFALFTDVKRLDRQARVVLVTSTVPMADMLLHQKLRIHADAYLDKRQLDERAILDTLERLLGLGFDAAELRRMARAAASTKRRSRPADAVDGESLEPALTTLLSEIGVDAPAHAEAAGQELDPELDSIEDEEDEAADEPDEHDELRERVAQLERELDVARQAARSSPFSSDYLTLAERADHGERHAARARRDADSRSRQAERLRDKLVQVAARLVESERARRAADELAEKLESRLSAADSALDQSRERLARAEREALAQSAAIEGLRRERVEAEQRAAAAALEVEARHAEALEAERARSTQERQRLAQENEAGLRELSAQLGRQSLEVLETRETDWQRRLDEERQARVRSEEELREAHRREMAELHESLEQALARKERQLAAELLAVTDEHEQKLERETAEWQARLDQAHRALASESVEVLEAHRREIEKREARHAARIEELTSRLRSLESSAHAELEEARREHERERARISAEHQQALAEQAHRHAEELTAAMADMRQIRSREDTQRLDELEEADRRRRAELAEMERRYRDEIELLRKLHEVELERLEVRQAGERERMQAERQVALDELARNVAASGPLPPPPAREEIRKAIEALDADPDF